MSAYNCFGVYSGNEVKHWNQNGVSDFYLNEQKKQHLFVILYYLGLFFSLRSQIKLLIDWTIDDNSSVPPVKFVKSHLSPQVFYEQTSASIVTSGRLLQSHVTLLWWFIQVFVVSYRRVPFLSWLLQNSIPGMSCVPVILALTPAIICFSLEQRSK